MANSLQLALRDAVAALLLADPPLAAGEVHTNREAPLPVGGAPSMINVRFVRSAPVEVDAQAMLLSSTSIRDWLTELQIVIQARKVDDDEAATVADALWVAAHDRVMAAQSLGGLAIGLFPGEHSVEDELADTTLCRATWSFQVLHRSTGNSIAST